MSDEPMKEIDPKPLTVPQSSGPLGGDPKPKPTSRVPKLPAHLKPAATGTEAGREPSDPNPPAPLSPLSPPSVARAASPPAPPSLAPEEKETAVFTPKPKTNAVIDKAKAAGVHVQALGDGRYEFDCLWSHEHPSGASSKAIYVEPTSDHPFGEYLCPHPHVEKRDAASLVDHLDVPLPAARSKPQIRLLQGDNHLAAEAAERILAADGTYFVTGGVIVRLVEYPGQGMTTEVVHEQTLITKFSSDIDWYRKTRNGDFERCEVSPSVVQSLLRGQDRKYLRSLTALAHQPYFRPDWTLVTKGGFDEQTGIYGAFDEADYDLDDLSFAGAQSAYVRLNGLVAEFPFATPSDKAAALLALLTAVVRPTLAQAPGFNKSATRSGSGKSYLAKVCGLMAMPGEPYSVSYPTDASEATKTVFGLLMEKRAVVIFDDMQTDIKSYGALNKALTSETITERVLGLSRTGTASTRVLFLFTGNGIEPEKDMKRRIVTIKLDPGRQTPALREFNFQPVDFIRNNRAYVVSWALTIIAAYIAHGTRPDNVKSIGSFEDWSELRFALMAVGAPDPAISLIDQVTEDSEQQLLEEFLELWWNIFCSRPVTVRTLVKAASEHPELMDVLCELGVTDGRFVNPGRLGWFLKRNLGRAADQLRIARAEGAERRAWKVITR